MSKALEGRWVFRAWVLSCRDRRGTEEPWWASPHCFSCSVSEEQGRQRQRPHALVPASQPLVSYGRAAEGRGSLFPPLPCLCHSALACDKQ